MHQCMPLVIPIPPTPFLSLFVPFFSLFSFLYPFLFSLFPPLCVFVSSFFAFCFCLLLSAFSFALLRRLPFRCFLLVSFCFPGVLGSWWRSLFGLVRISVLHPSRCLRARNLRKSAYSLVCFISCFPAVSFSLSSLFDFWFRFRFRFFDVELFFFFILSFSCGYYAVLSVSVATCTAYRMYLIRTCADLTFIFVWGVRCASVIMCIIIIRF